MSNNSKYLEEPLYEIWQNLDFQKKIVTADGDDIEILDPGTRDENLGGPDFKNARLRIGNLTFVGDVEIDINYSDWKTHAHNINNDFNKVILHVSLFNKYMQPYVYSKDGRKIPSISLNDCVDKNLVKRFDKLQKEQKSNHNQLKCVYNQDKVEIEVKKKFLAELGMNRFHKKCNKVYQRLKELTFLKQKQINEPVIKYEMTPEFNSKEFYSDEFKDKNLWLQLLYEFIFEALGYSQNKEAMLKLSQHAKIEFIDETCVKENFLINAEAILFNVGGLVPEVSKLPDQEKSDYSVKIYDIWKEYKQKYDGETLSETDWTFYKIRPQNFPTIRIAGGVRFLNMLLHENLLNRVVKKIMEIQNLNVLAKSLRSLFVIKSDGFWMKHFVFDQPAKNEIRYFIGASRADEIVVNVMLPFMAVYFDLFSDEKHARKVIDIYNVYLQQGENNIIRKVSEGLGVQDLKNSTVYTQGMIELFRNYCSKNRCMECEIGKVAFA